jgi:hypothetical protein
MIPRPPPPTTVRAGCGTRAPCRRLKAEAPEASLRDLGPLISSSIVKQHRRARGPRSTLTALGSVCARKTCAWRGGRRRKSRPGRETGFFIFRPEVRDPRAETRAQTCRLREPSSGCANCCRCSQLAAEGAILGVVTGASPRTPRHKYILKQSLTGHLVVANNADGNDNWAARWHEQRRRYPEPISYPRNPRLAVGAAIRPIPLPILPAA